MVGLTISLSLSSLSLSLSLSFSLSLSLSLYRSSHRYYTWMNNFPNDLNILENLLLSGGGGGGGGGAGQLLPLQLAPEDN